MKCNSECPFAYVKQYGFTYFPNGRSYKYLEGCPENGYRCRLLSNPPEWREQSNPRPENCIVPEQRVKKMKELLGNA
jgi:hypothetical protein